jgi:site-specific DNA-methyltransferase (adenine-specific)
MLSLLQGDCLEEMKEIPDGSIDLVLTDPPYGTTACKWDTVIPFEPMWEQLKRVTKKNGAIVLFGSQPFTSALVMSNVKMFKYEWVWDKKMPVGFLNAKKLPLRKHENILVFGERSIVYTPQMRKGKLRNKTPKRKADNYEGRAYQKVVHRGDNFNDNYYPVSIIEESNANQKEKLHPTQKPVALMEYLIKTYTNEGETVLDFTMGSGTTGVACKNLNRNFIGIELDKDYYEIACKRINNT